MPENIDDDDIFFDAQETIKMSQRVARHEPGLATDEFYACIREDARKAAMANRASPEQQQLIKDLPILEEPISWLGLKVATTNRLEGAGIMTLWDLLQQTRTQLLEIPHLGEVGVVSIFRALEGKGFRRHYKDRS